MKRFTVSLTHSEMTTLILDHLRTSEGAKDESVKRTASDRAAYLSKLVSIPPVPPAAPLRSDSSPDS